MPRHGNSKCPDKRSYYRQDPKIHEEVNILLGQGVSMDNIYVTLRKASTAVDEALMSPKFIDNRKYAKMAPISTSAGEGR